MAKWHSQAKVMHLCSRIYTFNRWIALLQGTYSLWMYKELFSKSIHCFVCDISKQQSPQMSTPPKTSPLWWQRVNTARTTEMCPFLIWGVKITLTDFLLSALVTKKLKKKHNLNLICLVIQLEIKKKFLLFNVFMLIYLTFPYLSIWIWDFGFDDFELQFSERFGQDCVFL